MIGSVANALELLQLFAGGREIRVNRASRALGLSRSTVHRLLATLAEYGYVEQDPATQAYLPGPALSGIGLAAAPHAEVVPADGLLARVARLTGETAHIMVLRGDHALCLDSVESEQVVRTASRVGWSLPSHATAGGKALLAALSDSEIDAIFPDATIRGVGRVPSVRKVDLLAELELVRATGYATNFGGAEAEVSGVAVLLTAGEAPASIAVTSPRTRGDEAWARTTGRRLLAIVEEARAAG